MPSLQAPLLLEGIKRGVQDHAPQQAHRQEETEIGGVSGRILKMPMSRPCKSQHVGFGVEVVGLVVHGGHLETA
jgi:hypothetical protein